MPAPVPPAPTGPARGARPWERRQLAFLRATLVPASDRDAGPEVARALQVLVEKAENFGGRVEEVGPLGMVAAFGLEPVEDAPRRAAHAAIAMRKATQRARPTAAEPIGLKIAIHATQGLVGQVSEGPLIDVAATSQAYAVLEALLTAVERDTILVSAPAVRALARRFELVPVRTIEPLGYRLEGLERPGLAPRGPMTPLVGRGPELEQLHRALGRAAAGHGQVMAIVREPGVGKSRLVWEATQADRSQGWLVLHATALSYGQATPYLPVVELLRAYFRVEDRDDVSQLERGLKSPSLKIIERLAKALDERPSELVRRADEEPPAGREGHDGTGRGETRGRETRGGPGNGSAGPKRRVVAQTPRTQARQLRAEQREARVVNLLLAGKTQAEVAREVGVSQSRVSQIRTPTRQAYVELTHEQWALYLPRLLRLNPEPRPPWLCTEGRGTLRSSALRSFRSRSGRSLFARADRVVNGPVPAPRVAERSGRKRQSAPDRWPLVARVEGGREVMVQDSKVKVVLIQRNGEIEALYASAPVELLSLDWRTESPTRSVLLTKVAAGPLADLPGSALELLCTRDAPHRHRGDGCPLDLPEDAATPTIPLTNELREILRRAEARRVQPFGRPRGPEEASLGDPGSEEPHPLHDEVLDTALLEGMHRAGVHPALIYAYQKTGRVVTAENQVRLTEEDREEWHEAVDDWYARQGQGDPHSE